MRAHPMIGEEIIRRIAGLARRRRRRCATTTSASTARATRTGSPATRSRSRRGSSPPPTPTRAMTSDASPRRRAGARRGARRARARAGHAARPGGRPGARGACSRSTGGTSTRASAAAPRSPARRPRGLTRDVGAILTPVLGIAVRALATALVVAVAGRLAARGGPHAAALVVGLPMNAGPGFLLVIGEGHDADFVARGALVSLSGCGAVLVFIALYARLVVRDGLARGLCVAVAGWLCFALPLTLRPGSALAGAAICAAGAASRGSPARPTRPPLGPPRPQRPGGSSSSAASCSASASRSSPRGGHDRPRRRGPRVRLPDHADAVGRGARGRLRPGALRCRRRRGAADALVLCGVLRGALARRAPLGSLTAWTLGIAASLVVAALLAARLPRVS